MFTNIETLPSDVLVEIFEHLDAKSMKNAALVSKKFLEATTNKFNLLLSNKTQSDGEQTLWIDRFDEIMKLQRRFQYFDVTFDERNYEKSLNMFSQITSKSAPIKRLVLRNIQFESLNDFLNMMRKMASLEELELSKVTFKPIAVQTNQAKRLKLSEIEPVLMRKLETITLCGSHCKILSYLIAPKTASLKIEYVPSSRSESLRNVLVNFMKPLKELKSVDFDFTTHVKLFSAPFPGKPLFKLTKWKTIDKTFNIIEDELMNFLTPHLPSLKDLEINCVTKKFLCEILQKCRRVERLKLYLKIPSNTEFYEGLDPIKGVRELIVEGDVRNFESVKAFLSLFPNLEKLKLSSHQNDAMINSLLPFINQINPELKSLSIPKLFDASEVKFECLEFFRIRNLEDPKALIVFLIKNPTIETLCISYWNDKLHIILKLLLNKTNVKHLQLSGELDTMKSIFDKIKVDYKNLKTLQITVNIGRNDETHVRKFEFPEDRRKWNANRSNDFDGIVPLPYHQWDGVVHDDEDNILADLGPLGLLMAVDHLQNIDHEFEIDEELNENDLDMDGQQ